ncbi:hypothetical protein DW322_08680 [Rhodococcus rhodnii]|uniref:Uncharacterized protein n=2 Tax=Rhodococcus rhodnii TaxID=38312 RepID=R7WU27_9NOCA|nr:hypothetical protein [Rhodococcus rhodnii]EOM77659.1 hypothetical protein Rrhod_0978 [Rhodococcus rhodnii LMG 5362]TXG90284.1 hypothetical protein DW322_08680 [Rhodococcus rhodnii]
MSAAVEPGDALRVLRALMRTPEVASDAATIQALFVVTDAVQRWEESDYIDKLERIKKDLHAAAVQLRDAVAWLESQRAVGQ